MSFPGQMALSPTKNDCMIERIWSIVGKYGFKP